MCEKEILLIDDTDFNLIPLKAMLKVSFKIKSESLLFG